MARRPVKRRKDPDPVSAFLGKSLSPEAMAQVNLADLSKKWEQVVGPVLAKSSRPVSLEDRVLVVACQSPAVAHEILIRRDIIAQKARNGWGLAVEGVRPSVRRVPLPRSAPPKRPAIVPIEPRPEEVERAKERIGGRIGREDVESALARLMATFRRRFGRKA